MFLDKKDLDLFEEYYKKGRIIAPVEDLSLLNKITDAIASEAANYLNANIVGSSKDFLDDIHKFVSSEKLNTLRLHVIRKLNKEPWLRPAYFKLAKSLLEAIVGNELCMQKNINLSIQLPDDDSSLLFTHADVWSGDSPYEVVVWLPLVDVFNSKSMYLLPPELNESMQDRMSSLETAELLYEEIENKIEWIKIDYGNVMLFNQNLMHGNRINKELASRWSMNCRFKSIMSPYADKRLGEFFEPISLRPATKIGMTYNMPRGF